jgi:hypothetical protein
LGKFGRVRRERTGDYVWGYGMEMLLEEIEEDGEG